MRVLHDAHRAVVMTASLCGHHSRTIGCGGCDPGALEYVLEDGLLGAPPLLRKTRPDETTIPKEER